MKIVRYLACALAVLMLGAAAASVAAAAGAPVPTGFFDGNVNSCVSGDKSVEAVLDLDGPWAGVNSESWPATQVSGDGVVVTIGNVSSENGQLVFDWSANRAVDLAVVKQGPGGAYWTYASPTNSGTLAAYKNGEPSDGVSHVLFCFHPGSPTPQPDDPTPPSDPTTPSNPSDPAPPSNPDTPSNPSDPTPPSNPDTPSNPSDPTPPSNPDTSTTLSSSVTGTPQTPTASSSIVVSATTAGLGKLTPPTPHAKAPAKVRVVAAQRMCPILKLARKTIPSGTTSRVKVVVAAASGSIKSPFRVRINGAGISRLVTVGRHGTVISLKPAKPGIATIRPLGHKGCVTLRLGVIGTYEPPVTG